MSFKALSIQNIGSFLFAHGKEGRPCQAICYREEERTVLLWTFPQFSPSILKGTIRPILEGHRSQEGDRLLWSAFGLSFVLHRDYDLENAAILPADVSLIFEHRNRQQLTFHRWGLPSELLREQDLKTFYYRVLGGRKDKVLTMEDDNFRGMPSVKVSFRRTGSHAMDKLYGGAWKGVGRIWHHREEQRLYAYEQAGPKKEKLLDEEDLLPC